MKKLLVGGLITSLFHASALAHSGGTDASGCHTVKKTGEYHCHGGAEPLVKEAKTEAKMAAKTEAKTEDDTIICTADVYNCSDFSSHGEAQDLMDYCMEMTGSDVHGLDGDDDGEGCESL